MQDTEPDTGNEMMNKANRVPAFMSWQSGERKRYQTNKAE